MLVTLLLLAVVFSFGCGLWITPKPSKTFTTTPNNNLRQLLRNGMILTDAMLKARHAEEYVMTQTHEALMAWEEELYAANDEEEEPCSPV